MVVAYAEIHNDEHPGLLHLMKDVTGYSVIERLPGYCLVEVGEIQGYAQLWFGDIFLDNNKAVYP